MNFLKEFFTGLIVELWTILVHLSFTKVIMFQRLANATQIGAKKSHDGLMIEADALCLFIHP